MVSEVPRGPRNVTPPPRVIAVRRARWLLRAAVVGSVIAIGFILAYSSYLGEMLRAG